MKNKDHVLYISVGSEIFFSVFGERERMVVMLIKVVI